jgi:hypothetical protein
MNNMKKILSEEDKARFEEFDADVRAAIKADPVLKELRRLRRMRLHDLIIEAGRK